VPHLVVGGAEQSTEKRWVSADPTAGK